MHSSCSAIQSWAVISILLFYIGGLLSEPSTMIHYTVEEEQPPRTPIGNIARDGNASHPNNGLSFTFLSNDEPMLVYFSIESGTGDLFIAQKIDRDEICGRLASCQVIFDVAVTGPVQYFEIATIYIDIKDINDNTPMFPQEEISILIPESTNVGASFNLPAAVDSDSDIYAIQKYEIMPSSDTFLLSSFGRLRLIVNNGLDRERMDNHVLYLVAYDGGNPPQTGSLIINITITDTNDNAPVFGSTSYEVIVPENTTVNATLVTVHAVDRDIGENGIIIYGFSEDTSTKFTHFQINPKTGDISLKSKLDFEDTKEYNLIVTAEDKGQNSFTSFATLTVIVTDENDNPPKISINTLTNRDSAEVSEDSNIGTFVAHIKVSDLDSNLNGQFSCGLDNGVFELESLRGSTYKIITAGLLDRETKDIYHVILYCEDRGSPPLSSYHNLTVLVQDANDNPPVFSQQIYYATIQENNKINDVIVQVEATDADEGNNGQIQYTLLPDSQDLFRIRDDNGIIFASYVLDYEKLKGIQFHVEARDLGTPALASTALVNVTILDVNDQPPVFQQDVYQFSVAENQLGSVEIGTVAATDADSIPRNQTLYSFFSNDTTAAERFYLNPETGAIRSKLMLDREEKPVYYLLLVAKDSSPLLLSSTATAIIHVTDENDNDPVILFPNPENNTVFWPATYQIGTPLTSISAIDQDYGQNAKLAYSITNENDIFRINKDTGALSVKSQPDAVGFTVYVLDILIKDHGIPPRNVTTILYVLINETSGGEVGNNTWSSDHDFYGEKTTFLSGSTLVIFTCVVAVFGVVIIILLASIAVVLYRARFVDKHIQEPTASSQTGSQNTPNGTVPVGPNGECTVANETPKKKKVPTATLR